MRAAIVLRARPFVACRSQAAAAAWPVYGSSRGFAATGVTPVERQASFRKMLGSGRIVRCIEAHSGLSTLVVDQAKATRADGSEVTYDALWSSSLTSSSIKGKPDIETVTTSERIQIVEDMLEVSSKPVVYDGDTGGAKEIFYFTVRKLERLGVSMCIIEDKAGLKQNSLFGTEREQQLEDIDVFCDKLAAGKAAQVTKDFMIVARIEALIAGVGLEEALKRARAYVTKGCADGVMIHSKDKKPDEILAFLKTFCAEFPDKTVVVVPTTYNTITEDELHAAGANVCIHANHLLRAAFPAMLDVANSILKHGRSKEVDDVILPVKKIITLIDDNTGS